MDYAERLLKYEEDTLFGFEGASPPYAPLAQLVEQLTLNQWVPGSSP
jgi:hypothetical protein